MFILFIGVGLVIAFGVMGVSIFYPEKGMESLRPGASHGLDTVEEPSKGDV